MKKKRLFFYGAIFLTVMSGLFSARIASGYASMKDDAHSEVVRQRRREAQSTVRVLGRVNPSGVP